MAVRINKGSAMQQLPVVPLVNTLLNLLIFFLVTTKFAEVDRAMEAALADADAAKPVSARWRPVHRHRRPRPLLCGREQGPGGPRRVVPRLEDRLDQQPAGVGHHPRRQALPLAVCRQRHERVQESQGPL